MDPGNSPDQGSWTGFAAVKYTAIVVIVFGILAFIAFYLIPLFSNK